jgi:hypothetical protein
MSDAVEMIRKLEARHMGRRVLYRLTSGSAPREGVVEELSPSRLVVRVSGVWVDNVPERWIELLPAAPVPARRVDPLAGKGRGK